jgi:uncharacterized protein YqiB (DUF1249 family)
MMDSKSARNMQNSLPNKAEKQCISLAFIIRIYHDARSSECQMSGTLRKIQNNIRRKNKTTAQKSTIYRIQIQYIHVAETFVKY